MTTTMQLILQGCWIQCLSLLCPTSSQHLLTLKMCHVTQLL